MPFCPNPDCPHKKKIGRPAEFREGITLCSDLLGIIKLSLLFISGRGVGKDHRENDMRHLCFEG